MHWPNHGGLYRFERKFNKYSVVRQSFKESIEIWEDVFLRLILILTWSLRYPAKEKGATRKGGIGFEMWNWRTSVHLHCGLKKISCRACLLYCFFGDVKIAFKGSICLFFHPWLLNSFDLLGQGSEWKKIYPLRLLLCLDARRR